MKEKKKSKLKFILVLAFTIIILLWLGMSYRANYLQTLEIGEQYLDVFKINMSYKYKIMSFNFILFFIIILIQNRQIKKGLQPFFDDEKKEMPKLANKSIAYILATIITLLISSIFTEKLILVINSIYTGTTDPIFNIDLGFYLFQKPFIKLMLYYVIGILIFITLYMAVYYIAVFNIYLKGIDKEILKKSKFIKQLKINAFLIVLTIAGFVFIGTYDIICNEFITLKDELSTKLVGAGLTDVTIKLWGYRILVAVIVISSVLILKSINTSNIKIIISRVLIVPVYLVGLFFVMILFNIVFVSNNKLDKEKQYIANNIEYTKLAYNLNITEEDIETTDTLTKQDIAQNSDIINNITLVDEDTTLKTLETLQTNSGYYTYRTTKLQKYILNGQETAVYVSPREIVSTSDTNTYSNKTYEYTHGYGSIITYSSKFSDNGNVSYVQKDFDSSDKQILVSEPRIYFGTETNNTIVTNTNGKTEFDYPINSTTSAEYTYNGSAGIKLNLLDRIILSIMKTDVNIAFSSGLNDNSKVLMNRNVIERAKTIMPYLTYDENPYLVVTDSGKQVWVLDAYTTSNEYPYSQKSTIKVGDSKKEINYIRNSVKVLIDAYDGTITFYITDTSDPIMMAYNKAYPTLFKSADEIPTDVSEHFVYSDYLYDVQSQVLAYYHNVTEDVLYRGDDVWDYATYAATKVSSAESEIEPYYTMVKTSSGEDEIGLIVPYTLYGKQNIVSYLVGTVENGKMNLTLYKYEQGSNVIGPKQLEKVIEEDEEISNEINSVNVTGTKIIKNMVIVPINNSLLYVETIYQQQLNEKNAIPLLKKVVVASGSKVAIGDTLEEALEKLLSQSATNIEVENTDTKDDLINTIIEANNDLKDSTKSSDYEMMGKDINKLQDLIEQLEEMQEEENKLDSTTTGNNTIDNTTENNLVE